MRVLLLLLLNFSPAWAAKFQMSCQGPLSSEWLQQELKNKALPRAHLDNFSGSEVFKSEEGFVEDLEFEKWLASFGRIATTNLGKASLRWALANPYLDSAHIKELQNSVRALHEEKELRDALQASLTYIHRYEDHDLWRDRIVRRLLRLLGVSNPLSDSRDIQNQLLRIQNPIKPQSLRFIAYGGVLSAGMLALLHTPMATEFLSNRDESLFTRLPLAALFSASILGAPTLGLLNNVYFFSHRMNLSGMKIVSSETRKLYPRLKQSRAPYLREMGDFLETLFEDSGDFSKNLHKLSELKTSFSPLARLLDAVYFSNFHFPQMQEGLRDEFVRTVALASLLGELDMLLGFGKLLDEGSVFPEILDSAATHVEIVQGKNPYLLELARRGEVPKVVANDFRISNRKDGVEAKIQLLTGQNGEGKTSYIRMIAMLLSLAQNGAPVPADSMKFTPTSVITSIKNTDDTSEGKSLFISEAGRIAKIIERARSAKRPLILMDESFRGTTHEEKVALEYGALKYFSKQDILAVFATHNRALQEVTGEIDGLINFHVSDSRERRFQVLSGASHRTNAFEVAREQGFPEEILNYGREYLNRQ